MSAALDLPASRPTCRAASAPRRVVASPPSGAFGIVAWPHLTRRQREVFARPRTMGTLLDLVRERPRGACVVCWRDMGNTLAGADELSCGRKDNPDATTTYCSGFASACREQGRRQAEVAKASAIAELEAGHV
ncbi:hypothetical protein [Myxococcus sp. CA040A]|uniref:hypothetical protein n=1 Tax=Myxococcus sp. CA040A TaxID=2741738 RepID=UPI00157A3C60|nr:hypothetical protein [Myxococcus sp. CA040A]NTX08930.1 hypothetical protein [Myxococcus sp. CA040A]